MEIILKSRKVYQQLKLVGIFGVGLGEGQLKYSIPESHNDFIFAILIEEFGVLFGLFVAFLYPVFFIMVRRSILSPSNLFINNTIFSLMFFDVFAGICEYRFFY